MDNIQVDMGLAVGRRSAVGTGAGSSLEAAGEELADGAGGTARLLGLRRYRFGY